MNNTDSTKKIITDQLKGRGIIFWGAGDTAHIVYNNLNKQNINPIAFISREYKNQNSKKIYSNSFPVFGKDFLDKQKHFIVISSQEYRLEIAKELRTMGFVQNVDFVDYFGNLINRYHRDDYFYKGVSVGKYTMFGFGFDLAFENGFIESIGRFCSINETARIHADHAKNLLSTSGAIQDILEGEAQKKLFMQADGWINGGKLTIGNDVWIGQNVFINATKCKYIGNGAIIGAGAIVLENIPDYAVAVGVPAKVKKFRFSKSQIDILQRIEWWKWDDEQIRQNSELFIYPKKFFEYFNQLEFNGDEYEKHCN